MVQCVDVVGWHCTWGEEGAHHQGRGKELGGEIERDWEKKRKMSEVTARELAGDRQKSNKEDVVWDFKRNKILLGEL